MNRVLIMSVVTAAMTVLPALAQNEIQCNQPVTRRLNADEVRIQGKIKLDFDKGLIDSTQLAAFQRDFDGIMVQEDALKSRGLAGDGREVIAQKLWKFERKLDRSSGVCTTEEANNKVGPVADENNIGLSHIEPSN